MSRGPLLAFDFDHTIAELNTDVEVQKLHPDGKIPETSEIFGLYSTSGWTDFMREVFKLLHSHDVKKKDILTLMAGIDFAPGMEELIRKSVANHNAKIIIISDSNSVFIEHILEVKGIRHLVDVVYTNPAEWRGELLHIEPYHHQEHCDLSSVNLCKGTILEDYIKSQDVEFSFIGYVGDGRNDFCPALRLKEGDMMFVREGYSLQKHIPKLKEERNLEIRSEVHYWNSGAEILDLIEKKSKNND